MGFRGFKAQGFEERLWKFCRKFERLVSLGAYTVFKTDISVKFADRLTLSVLLRSGLTWLFGRMSDECALGREVHNLCL